MEKTGFVRVVTDRRISILSQKKTTVGKIPSPENINHPQLSEGAQSIAANGKSIVLPPVSGKDTVCTCCDLYITEIEKTAIGSLPATSG